MGGAWGVVHREGFTAPLSGAASVDSAIVASNAYAPLSCTAPTPLPPLTPPAAPRLLPGSRCLLVAAGRRRERGAPTPVRAKALAGARSIANSPQPQTRAMSAMASGAGTSKTGSAGATGAGGPAVSRRLQVRRLEVLSAAQPQPTRSSTDAQSHIHPRRTAWAAVPPHPPPRPPRLAARAHAADGACYWLHRTTPACLCWVVFCTVARRAVLYPQSRRPHSMHAPHHRCLGTRT